MASDREARGAPAWSALALTAVCASVAESVTFPLDTTKTRMQLQVKKGSGIAGRVSFLETALATARLEGIQGFYRGLSPAVLRHVVYSGVRITAYEQVIQCLRQCDCTP